MQQEVEIKTYLGNFQLVENAQIKCHRCYNTLICKVLLNQPQHN